MTEVCYDEMGVSAPLGFLGETVAPDARVYHESDQVIEERRRWAVELAAKFAMMDTRSLLGPADIQRWAQRFFNFADAGSFDPGDSK